MKVLVRHLLKKTRAGGYAQRDELIEAPSIRFGRGADCEIHMTDPRMLLHHVELTERPGGLFIESLGSIEFQVNGRLSSASSIKVGDEVHIGPYDLIVLEAGEDQTAAFSLEYARPLGDELAALKARSNTETKKIGLGVRGWAWIMFLTAIGIGIIAPLSAFYSKDRGGDPMAVEDRSFLERADEIWQSGPFSGVHAHFGNQCETCHVNEFEQVTVDVCVACHQDAGHHADPVAFPVGSLEGQQCENCHKEHTGGEDLMITGEAFCTSCHGQFSEVAPNSRLLDASGFETHPEFYPTIVTNVDEMTFERISVAADPPPIDGSNINFPHKTHLNPEGMRTPSGGRFVITCENCHQPETGGIAMLPVRYEDKCGGCHVLLFEPSAPDRVMPHGDVEAAKLFVEDTYAALALRGGYNAEDETAPPVARRLVGTSISDEDRELALEWAERKAAEVLDGRYGRGLCGQCHTVRDGETPRDWTVAPVHLTKRWLPKGFFTHDQHRDRSCSTCHNAAESTSARDVILPSIEVCQACHGGEFAAGKTRTGCTDCHGFHREDLPRSDTVSAESATLPVGHPLSWN